MESQHDYLPVLPRRIDVDHSVENSLRQAIVAGLVERERDEPPTT